MMPLLIQELLTRQQPLVKTRESAKGSCSTAARAHTASSSSKTPAEQDFAHPKKMQNKLNPSISEFLLNCDLAIMCNMNYPNCVQKSAKYSHKDQITLDKQGNLQIRLQTWTNRI